MVRSPIIMKLLSGRSVKRLQPAQPGQRLDARPAARRLAGHGLGDRADVRRRGAAAAADDVQPAVGGELAQRAGHLARASRRSRRTRWAGRRWDSNSTKTGAMRDSSSTYGRIISGPSAQLMPTLNRSACEIEFQKASTVWRRERAAAFEDRDRDHHRQPHAGALEVLIDGEQAGLQVQRVEGRLGTAGCRRPLRPAPRPARSRSRPSGRT